MQKVSIKLNFHILERINRGCLQIIVLNLMINYKKLGKKFGKTLCSSYFISVFRFSLNKKKQLEIIVGI